MPKTKNQSIILNWECRIDLELMSDPVVAPDRFYDRKNLITWYDKIQVILSNPQEAEKT